MRGKYVITGSIFLFILILIIYSFLLGKSFSWSPIMNEEKHLTSKEKSFIKSLLNEKIKKIDISENVDLENDKFNYIFKIYLNQDLKHDTKIILTDKILDSLYTEILENKYLFNIDLISVHMLNIKKPEIIYFRRSYAINDLSYIFGFKIIKKGMYYVRQNVDI
jgi:hypothetical protein